MKESRIHAVEHSVLKIIVVSFFLNKWNGFRISFVILCVDSKPFDQINELRNIKQNRLN